MICFFLFVLFYLKLHKEKQLGLGPTRLQLFHPSHHTDDRFLPPASRLLPPPPLRSVFSTVCCCKLKKKIKNAAASVLDFSPNIIAWPGLQQSNQRTARPPPTVLKSRNYTPSPQSKAEQTRCRRLLYMQV